MRRAVFLVCALLAACGSSDRDRPPAGDGGGGGGDGGTGRPAPLGADTRGNACTTGCGADDDRLCSSTTSDCPLCLVDPASDRITYCTQDCTADPCPSGWTCVPVKAFGQDQVTQACVADPAVCGDGVIQLGEGCDGDDPQQGMCVDCVGFAAVCGDGVLQAGEVCDGDDPQLGRCVDCAGYASICGDGVVQSDEVCDGDTEAYCIDCARLETPSLTLTVRTVQTNGVRENRGNMTDYYGFALERGPVTFALPAAGDANGCGRAEVLETTEALTRVALTICDASVWGRATWTIALPRGLERFDGVGEVPEAFLPGHTVASLDGAYQLSWGRGDADRLAVSSFQVDDPAIVRGNITAVFSQTDPMASFANARAEFDAAYEILHPRR